VNRAARIYPLLIGLGVELVFVLWLGITHRNVIGHDAFQYFGVQYYFLNNAANSGEIAQWIPFLTHGTVANWWYGIQAGIFQCTLLAFRKAAPILLGRNFLPLFLTGIFFDHVVLLLGVWLLSRRYFTSNLTILFVVMTVLGSTIWFTQPWYGIHCYYALPLIFHFIHSLLETGRWRYFLLAGNLFVVQTNGSLPYLLPLSALVVFCYTLFTVVFFWREARQQLATLLRNAKYAVVPLILVLASLYCVHTMLNNGTKEIANYAAGRTLEGKATSLQVFMAYGTNSNLRWSELLTRVSSALDYTVYFGLIALALACLSLTIRPSRRLLVVACTALVILLIANGTPLAMLLYYTWPMMKFYRHLSTASTIVRLLACLMAGFGFEALILGDYGAAGRKRFMLTAGAFVAVALALFFLSDHPSLSLWQMESVMGWLPVDWRTADPQYLRVEFVKSSLACFGAALVFLLLARGTIERKWLALGVVLFQTLDIYSFKAGLAGLHTIPLTPEQYRVSEFQRVPYSPRRLPVDYRIQPRARLVPQNGFRAFGGASYWSADAFMFTDPPENFGRADHWLWSLDDFLRTYSGEKIRDLSHKPSAFAVWSHVRFPHVLNALKLAGVIEDKISFFARAFPNSDDRGISAWMASPDYRGDLLFVSDIRSVTTVPFAANDRRQHFYEVLRYDANNIAIRVHGAQPGEWLYYADCWHPFWSARVNGRPSRLYKANLAYKAVPLAAGDNVVEFRFYSAKTALVIDALNWNGALWFALVIALLGLEWKRAGAANP